MGKIFCVMGKSATGKDTIYQRLLNESNLDLKRIIPIGEDDSNYLVSIKKKSIFSKEIQIYQKQTKQD